MDYEKKYNEALRLAKSYYGPETNEFLDAIFPELKESEDEMTRKELIEYLTHRAEVTPFIDEDKDCKRWIAYLEKQKDSDKAVSAIEKIDKYIDARTANAHDMDDSNPDKKYYQGWDDALGKVAGILQDVYSNEKQKEQPSTAEDIAAAYQMGLAEGRREQKSVWSKEDEKFIKDLCNLLASLAKDNRVGCYYAPDLISKIKSLRLKPKQGWSKEDKEHLDVIIEGYEELLEDYSANHGIDYIPYNSPVVARTVSNDIKFLKSLPERFNLQPKQEWSEEDEDYLRDVKCAVYDYFDEGYAEELCDWLHPHWKPSEEQMEQLRSAAVLPEFGPMVTARKQFPDLESLYNDLKKLI